MAMGIVNVPSSGAGAADELLMTGYEKPASASPVEATDTVVEAIGKIEAGLDGSAGGGSCGVRLADVTSVGYDTSPGKVTVTWTDPSDVTYQNASIARWAGTKLVRKVGSAPANESDGTVVKDSKTRNQYKTTGFVDSGLTDGTSYYYRFFPYTDVGTHTKGTSFNATPNKIATTMTVTKTGDAYGVTGTAVQVGTITTDGDGQLTATSSNTNVGTVSISNKKVYVTPKAEGTITVTVNQLAGINYSSAGPKTISVTVGIISTTLGNNTPAKIKAAIQQGIAASLWNVGDKVGIAINGTVGKLTFNNETFYASILGFDHNKDRESGGAHNVHFIFGKTANNVDICFVDSGYGSNPSGADYFRHHTSDTNTNGWSGSDLRTMCSTFLGCMPAEWQAVIGSSTKYSDNTGNNGDTASKVTATQDKLFLLAEWEVFGARTYANSAEKNYQQQYDYYKNGNSKIRYKYNDTSYEAYWWLRSVCATSSSNFCYVISRGSVGNYGASDSNCFAPGFAIF